MNLIKKLSLIIVCATMLLTVMGCSNTKTEEKESNGFYLVYEGQNPVDKIVFNIGDVDELKMKPSEGKKIITGDYEHVAMDHDSNATFSVKVTDEGEVIFEKTINNLDLGEGKKAIVKIVQGNNGSLDLEVTQE